MTPPGLFLDRQIPSLNLLTTEHTPMKNFIMRLIMIVLALIILGNVGFWILVSMSFAPVQGEYEEGRIVRLGGVALVFGHGTWNTEDNVYAHWTSVQLNDSTTYNGTTLALVDSLHADGATWVWGTWCHTGEHSYIQKNTITGVATPWPTYVSRNTTAGVTIPVWVGLGFYRLGMEGNPLHVVDAVRLNDMDAQEAWEYVVHEASPAEQYTPVRMTVDAIVADSMLRAHGYTGVDTTRILLYEAQVYTSYSDTLDTHSTMYAGTPSDYTYVGCVEVYPGEPAYGCEHTYTAPAKYLRRDVVILLPEFEGTAKVLDQDIPNALAYAIIQEHHRIDSFE